MADNKSISATELGAEVRTAVAKLAIKGIPAEPTIIAHPPWIWGFIMRDFGNPAELPALASRVAAELPSAKGGTPVTLIAGPAAGGTAALLPQGHIICGYIRDPNIFR
jgi:hypothetical protein